MSNSPSLGSRSRFFGLPLCLLSSSDIVNGPGLEGAMVAPVTNHKAVVELPEGSCGSGWCRNPLPELTGGDMCLHFSREDSGPLKSHRAQGVGPCCSLECSHQGGWPCLGSSPDLKWPKAKSSRRVLGLNILCVLCQVPLPGPLSLGCRDPVGPVRAEILRFGRYLDPTHSEWPQTGAWQGGRHPVLCHPPSYCLDPERYLKSRP